MYNYEELMDKYYKTWWSFHHKYGNAKFSDLLGKTIAEIHGMKIHNDVIFFVCDDGSIYKMYHEQDCCEEVDIEDIVGEAEWLIGSPIILAEEVCGESNETGSCSGNTCTWTFYHMATLKGYVTIRWYGESNGYYSESVDFLKVRGTDEEESKWYV